MTAIERLTAALLELADRDQRTPCQGRRSARWTSDKHDDLEWAAWVCTSMACPLLALCGQAADELKVTACTWGGTVRSPKPKRKAS
ncbi:MAG TPA: hypothetical protein VGN48_17945 [Pedococcus sp.]|nr:hypothetical protein [Pedococcus sp.]